ncbi:MAG: glutamate-1-semialdehyde 2,1-aminomutase [Candidatus Bathyarchaeota archaeon]|nr:MAG: glutamate-1-semialdehyde 2,1-aminomutase [Candidatus Bathyarchaeota archaeon]
MIEEFVREKILNTYAKRTTKSKELWEAARKVIPGGAGSGFRYYEPYPIFLKRGSGSRVWDVDGNEYLDYCMSFGALIAGHAHPKIVEAVKEQLEKGSMYGIPHEKTAEYVKELLRRFTAMDMFRLTNSGTEGTMHALRLARAHTGKDKIVKIEGCYHGAHDYLLVSVFPPLSKAGPRWAPTLYVHGEGIPLLTVKNTLVAPYNDVEAMETLFRKHEGEIAALIMEPVPMNMGLVLPKQGYLKDIRKLTEEYNILLIFDEVKTGIRIAPGGACEYYGVDPDIVVLGKAIAGGFSAGAFGGKEDIFSNIYPLGHAVHAGTYNANPVAVTAGLTCLKHVMTTHAQSQMNDLGEDLASGVKAAVEDTGFEAQVPHIGPSGTVYFTDVEVVDYRTASTYDKKKNWEFWFSLLNHGVLTPPGLLEGGEQWLVSAAHQKETIEKALVITESALREIK